MPAKNTNSKKEAGRLKKEAQANIKAEKEAGIQEEVAAKDWKRGANLKGAARSEASCEMPLMISQAKVFNIKAHKFNLLFLKLSRQMKRRAREKRKKISWQQKKLNLDQEER